MGITFDNELQQFVFDFEHDGKDDMVSLTGRGYQVEAFGAVKFAQPMLHSMELVKALPSSITFDMNAYEKQYLNEVLENGRPRYTETQKEDVRNEENRIAIFSLIGRKDLMADAM